MAVLEHGDKSAGVRMLRASPEEEIGWMTRVELKQGATKAGLYNVPRNL